MARQIKKHKLGGYKGAEIISADSRQVYKYLDVGTNKVHGNWQSLSGSTAKFYYKNVIHHCMDFVHPRNICTVAEYKTCAKRAIKEIINRGNIPIVVGGTGFYIQAVVDGLVLPNVPPNKKLRAALEKKSAERLFDMLKKLDPERAKHIDAKNPRRLIRAIEICKATGKPIPQLKTQNEFKTLLIGIKKSDIELKKAIEKRSQKQVPGVTKELALLTKMRVPIKRIRELGFEYRLALRHLETKLPNNKLELARMLAKENWRYAKQQMTWFKKNKNIVWISSAKKAESFVKTFLLAKNPLM